MNPPRILHPDDWAAAASEPDFELPLPGGKLTMLFRPIPAGSFVIGSRGYSSSEEPRHIVTIAEPFLLGKFVVTEEEYTAVERGVKLKRDPERRPRNRRKGRYPAVNVSFHEAEEWCRALEEWLSEDHPKLRIDALRLPSEAEWEYACRAGSRTEYWNGDGEKSLCQVGWFHGGEDNMLQETHVVGVYRQLFEGNAGYRLHDVDEYVTPYAVEQHPARLRGMHGNVVEWCSDGWVEDHRPRWSGEAVHGREGQGYRVFRGGSWSVKADRCRSAFRPGGSVPGVCTDDLGFRVCLVCDPLSHSSGGRGAVARSKRRPANAAPTRASGMIWLQASAAGEPQASTGVIDWRDAVAPGFGNWDVAAPAAVEAIIVGTTPEGPAAGQRGGMADFEVSLPVDLGTRFPNLTHLFLWGIKGLAELPPLPEGLLFLDLRGCSDLERLPNLPPRLQSLDLGGCVGLRELPPLPPALDWLALDDCKALRSFKPVEEFLQKVITGDQSLTNAAGRVAPFDTLILHGCRFNDLDSALCGEKPNENVFRRILDHFAGTIEHQADVLLECKIIVLGDGRVGKTSLVRALKGLRFKDTDSTENIRLWAWNDALKPFPKDKTYGDRYCRLNVWDFAGQDYYHHTHRLFLQTRAVFVIVWREWTDEDAARRDTETRADGSSVFNTPHELSYWIDQALESAGRADGGDQSVDGPPPVIVVRTATDKSSKESHEDWSKRVKQRYPDVECLDVSVKPADSPKGQADRNAALERVRNAALERVRKSIFAAVKRELRDIEASSIARGTVAVRGTLSQWQPTCQDDDDTPPRSAKPFCSMGEFRQLVGDEYGRIGLAAPPEERFQFLLDRLHGIGAVYSPRSWRGRQAGGDLPVIIDQAWAIGAIYASLSNAEARAFLQQAHGRADLEQIGTNVLGMIRDDRGTLYPPDVQDVLREFMMACGIIVPLHDTLEGLPPFVFPQFLPTKDILGERTGGAHYCTDKANMGQECAGLLVAWLVRTFKRPRLFRFGAVGELEIATGPEHDGEKASVRLCVEWCPLTNAPTGRVHVTIERGTRDVDAAVLRWLGENVVGIYGFPGDLRFVPTDVNEAGKIPYQPVVPEVLPSRVLSHAVAPREQLIRVGISFAGENEDNPGIEDTPKAIYERLMAVKDRPYGDVINYRVTLYPPTVSGLIAELAECDFLVVCVTRKYLESRYCLSEFLLMAQRCDSIDNPFIPGKQLTWHHRMVIVRGDDDATYGLNAPDYEIPVKKEAWKRFWAGEFWKQFPTSLSEELPSQLADLVRQCKGHTWLQWLHDHQGNFTDVLDRIRDRREEADVEKVAQRVIDKARTLAQSLTDSERRRRLRKRLRDLSVRRYWVDAIACFEQWLDAHEDPRAARDKLTTQPLGNRFCERVRRRWLRKQQG